MKVIAASLMTVTTVQGILSCSGAPETQTITGAQNVNESTRSEIVKRNGEIDTDLVDAGIDSNSPFGQDISLGTRPE